MLYKVIKPILFSIDAEKSHSFSLKAFDKAAYFLPEPSIHSCPTKVMGITFPNKIGLAAGLDKNGEHIRALAKLGFGFIEVGTVTPKPQMGNPKPRLFRLKNEKAIINRMGFNNGGVEELVNNVRRNTYNGILGINIGKNKDTPNKNANDDYLTCLEAVYPFADYITANISSPNTAGLRELQNQDSIKSLIDALKEKQSQLTNDFGYKPIVIKIAPDICDETIKGLAKIFTAHDIDGVIATNTTINKISIKGALYANEEGGLSGKPLTQQSTHVIKTLVNELSNNIPVIGVGGIMSTKDAQDKIDAGAKLIQVYSGLIYQGPKFIKTLTQTIK
ncbi:MAG: quinone-dependent dihydroorotate dehydrogenase [Gammaproteobacteria bacterium]|nr:quinone-dependent dihydroorotate dehydrogenase [Gammaproteobacteria bacterium]